MKCVYYNSRLVRKLVNGRFHCDKCGMHMPIKTIVKGYPDTTIETMMRICLLFLGLSAFGVAITIFLRLF